MQSELDAALLRFFCAAYVVAGNESLAAALLLRLVARDPGFQAPAWMRELFGIHREALAEAFHRRDHGREDDFGEGVSPTTPKGWTRGFQPRAVVADGGDANARRGGS